MCHDSPRLNPLLILLSQAGVGDCVQNARINLRTDGAATPAYRMICISPAGLPYLTPFMYSLGASLSM